MICNQSVCFRFQSGSVPSRQHRTIYHTSPDSDTTTEANKRWRWWSLRSSRSQSADLHRLEWEQSLTGTNVNFIFYLWPLWQRKAIFLYSSPRGYNHFLTPYAISRPPFAISRPPFAISRPPFAISRPPFARQCKRFINLNEFWSNLCT